MLLTLLASIDWSFVSAFVPPVSGPIFDPVHGVIHHFYQIHLAAPPGHGPDYGHFVSKDFVNWAQMPVAIWNGIDSSVTPHKITKYDNEVSGPSSSFMDPAPRS